METQKLHEQKAPKKAQSQQPRLKPNYELLNWFLGSAWEPRSRGSASLDFLEAEPLDGHSQAEPGNE